MASIRPLRPPTRTRPDLRVPGVVLEILILIAWILLVNGHEVAGAIIAVALLAYQIVESLGYCAQEEEVR